MPFESINPATGEVEATFAAHDDAEVERRIAAAWQVARSWRQATLTDRAALVRRVGDLLEAECAEHAAIISAEMGKLLPAAREEVLKCASACRFYADNAAAMLADEPAQIEGEDAFVAFDPLGVVLAVMPWNFPYWQVMRFAAPAVVAGNVGLLKHASNVPRCALELEAVFARAGAPAGVFQALLIESERVGAVIADHRVAAVTLTGSEAAGSSVASQAGTHIKKTVLELGGSDPFVVLPSADLELAAETAVRARMVNTGQSCIAAKRFIVHREVAAEFERLFVDRMKALVVGNPDDPASQVGPLSSDRHHREVEEQVKRTLQLGGRLLTGGSPIDRPGFYFAPTVITDVPAGSPPRDEEIFGPVAAVFVVDSLDEAIELANATRFGLGASAWTTDESDIESLVRRLDAGSVFINGMVASDPRVPFGGVKASGYGRELGIHGLREFTNIKTVRIRRSPSTPAAGPREASE